MELKKINSEQIDQLYLFTRQHFVEYYDLQTELVDHLANAIETQWQLEPTRTFDEALQIEFKKFGVFGFMDVVEKRQVVLQKKYAKIVWSHFKNFFRLPQILGTFSAVGILFFILRESAYSKTLFLSIASLLLLTFFFEIFRNARNYKTRTQKTGKKWLFKEIINSYGQGMGFAYLPFQIIFQFREHLNNDILLFIASFGVVAIALSQYIVLVLIPKKAEQYLIQTYPEYEFSK